MNDVERVSAVQEIKQLKAKYFRGVDTADGELVRSILAEDCVLDMMGCCTDPATGRDLFPAMNVVMRGRDSWISDGLSRYGIVSAHQGHNVEVEFTGETTANVIWSMTDRLWFPPGEEFSLLTGYGYYHDTCEKVDGSWKLKTSTIKRIRVEVC